MSLAATKEYGKVNASPTKEFFVSMLTRDISLEDAILDLLDNCVDGILRNKLDKLGKLPYQGHQADIIIEPDYFSISDDCGGIPWDLHDYAFRMGRPVDAEASKVATVGVYGIGMKRAIFKIGRECSIQTRNSDDAYQVDIDGNWLTDESDWKLTAKPIRTASKEEGTVITIKKLLPEISIEFSKRKESFIGQLSTAIKTHYSAIIEKGFRISINNTFIKPNSMKFAFDQTAKKDAIRPYIFRTQDDGVAVFVTVGLTRPIPDENEELDAIENPKYDSDRAGWTIICNDRVVMYCDKSEKTGWGVSQVPRYHPQFIAISGVVEFISKDAKKLPTVTTKRGLDMGSRLYLQVRERMIEGMKIFTDFTNKWKVDTDEAKRQMKDMPLLSLSQLKEYSVKNETAFISLKRTTGGAYLKPELPRPEKHTKLMRRISFTKPVDQIITVSHYLFGEGDHGASEVGEKCFNNVLEKARN